MAKSMTKVTPAEQKKTVTENKFDKEDLVTCKSITDGELFMVGAKSRILYKWADYGDVQDVEYQDLVYDVHLSGNSSYSKYPSFIILNDDFIAQNKAIKEVYDKMYSVGDLRDILNLSVDEMANAISHLPDGAKDAILGVAGRMINDRTLDSVAKIRALDEIFGTDMLHMLTDN